MITGMNGKFDVRKSHLDIASHRYHARLNVSESLRSREGLTRVRTLSESMGASASWATLTRECPATPPRSQAAGPSAAFAGNARSRSSAAACTAVPRAAAAAAEGPDEAFKRYYSSLTITAGCVYRLRIRTHTQPWWPGRPALAASWREDTAYPVFPTCRQQY